MHIDIHKAPPTLEDIKNDKGYTTFNLFMTSIVGLACGGLMFVCKGNWVLLPGVPFVLLMLWSHIILNRAYDAYKTVSGRDCADLNEWRQTDMDIARYIQQVNLQKRELIEAEYDALNAARIEKQEKRRKQQLYAPVSCKD